MGYLKSVAMTPLVGRGGEIGKETELVGNANAKNDPAFATLATTLFHALIFGVNESLEQLFHVHPGIHYAARKDVAQLTKGDLIGLKVMPRPAI